MSAHAGRILIVEDDEGIAALARRHLQRAGHEVCVCRKGEEALAAINAEPPELMVLDFALPDMTGQRLLERLAEADRSVPFIVTTGHGGESIAVEFMKRGALDYIIKDDSFWEMLTAAIPKALEQVRNQARLRKAEDDLKEKDRLNEALLDAMPCLAILTDGEGRILNANLPARRQGAVAGSAQAPAMPPALRDAEALHEAMAEGRTVCKQRTIGHRPHEITWIPLNRGRCLVYAQDISERREVEQTRRRLERQFHSAERIEAAGRLAGSLAHDFNNLLTSILGYADLQLKQLEDQSRAHRYAENIVQTARQAADLTGKLLSFSQRSELRFAPTDVHELIRTVTEEVSPSFDGVALKTELEAPNAEILGDGERLRGALRDLLVNARESIAGEGEVSVRTEMLLPDGADRPPSRSAPPGTYLAVSVRDTGCGIGEGDLEHIFEPFYTTKTRGKCAGMGLPTAHGCIRDHFGALKVESRRGAGSVFTAFLPLAAGSLDECEPARPGPPLRGRLLLVAGNPAIRNAVSLQLQDLGHEVKLCADVEEAIELWEGGAIDCEVALLGTLPGERDEELVSRLLSMRPGFSILFLDGYLHAGRQRDEAGRVWVRTPLRTGQLCRDVSGALLASRKEGLLCGPEDLRKGE
jgi:signal transduction histidine kinase